VAIHLEPCQVTLRAIYPCNSRNLAARAKGASRHAKGIEFVALLTCMPQVQRPTWQHKCNACMPLRLSPLLLPVPCIGHHRLYLCMHERSSFWTLAGAFLCAIKTSRLTIYPSIPCLPRPCYTCSSGGGTYSHIQVYSCSYYTLASRCVP
jgi:hypothetical protein